LLRVLGPTINRLLCFFDLSLTVTHIINKIVKVKQLIN
jgi:hypothetical protein